VLDFQSESGKLELNEEGSLFELIEQVIDLFKYAALQKKNIFAKIDSTIPQYI
jgi:hypothetical protein